MIPYVAYDDQDMILWTFDAENDDDARTMVDRAHPEADSIINLHTNLEV